jgi:rubrerythrin
MDQTDQRLLELCEQIELLAGQAYRKLAELHASDRELAALWTKTASEEDNHAAQFRVSAAMLAGMVDYVRVTSVDAVAAIDRLQAFLTLCAASPPSPIEALSEMIALEESLASFHLDNAAAFVRPEHRKLFQAMMNADRGHVEALRAALVRRTGGTADPSSRR